MNIARTDSRIKEYIYINIYKRIYTYIYKYIYIYIKGYVDMYIKIYTAHQKPDGYTPDRSGV